jgi:hypothetical protein
MWNFRVRPSLERLANEAIARTGMDRSTFIRDAVEEKAVSIMSGPKLRIGNDTAAKSPERDVVEPVVDPDINRVLPEDCLHPKESVVFMPGLNLRLCQLCGGKFK